MGKVWKVIIRSLLCSAINTRGELVEFVTLASYSQLKIAFLTGVHDRGRLVLLSVH